MFGQPRRPRVPVRTSLDLDGHRRPHTPSYHILDWWRELDDARRLLKDLTGRLHGKPLFVSDELFHCGTALAELFHKLILAAPAGKRGPPRNPERIVDADLDYATVHKTRQGGRVITSTSLSAD